MVQHHSPDPISASFLVHHWPREWGVFLVSDIPLYVQVVDSYSTPMVVGIR
jgi:hypothetical protein